MARITRSSAMQIYTYVLLLSDAMRENGLEVIWVLFEKDICISLDIFLSLFLVPLFFTGGNPLYIL